MQLVYLRNQRQCNTTKNNFNVFFSFLFIFSFGSFAHFVLWSVYNLYYYLRVYVPFTSNQWLGKVKRSQVSFLFKLNYFKVLCLRYFISFPIQNDAMLFLNSLYFSCYSLNHRRYYHRKNCMYYLNYILIFALSILKHQFEWKQIDWWWQLLFKYLLCYNGIVNLSYHWK